MKLCSDWEFIWKNHMNYNYRDFLFIIVFYNVCVNFILIFFFENHRCRTKLDIGPDVENVFNIYFLRTTESFTKKTTLLWFLIRWPSTKWTLIVLIRNCRWPSLQDLVDNAHKTIRPYGKMNTKWFFFHRNYFIDQLSMMAASTGQRLTSIYTLSWLY